MKKFIISVICLISIVPIYFLCTNRNNIDFPHFKQSNIKYNGTIYTSEKNKVYLETFFIDENISSEMASNSNIERIYIIDKSGQRLKVKDISLEVGYENKNTLIRVLKSTIELNENGGLLKDQYSLDKMVIKYIDKKEEIFDLGELNVNTKKSTADKLAYHSYQEIVTNSTNPIKVSGIIIKLGKLDYEKIMLKNIDLGLKGIDVDYKNIRILDDYNPESEEDYKNISNLQVSIDKEQPYNFNGLELNFKENEMITMVVPFKMEKDFQKENIMYIVNPKLTLEFDGIKEVLTGDMECKNNFDIDDNQLKIQLERDGI